MNSHSEPMARDPRVGLCGDCRHAESVVSARGSVFCLCRRSFSDPTFRKYPAIPVIVCGGYEAEQRGGPG
jgi:hypothetical protein